MNQTPSQQPQFADIGSLLDRAIEAGRTVQQSLHNAGEETAQTVEAADGKIRIEARFPGKVKIDIVDPRAMRMDSGTLSKELTSGVNAALQALQEQVTGGDAGIDIEGLTEHLQEIQQESSQQLSNFMDGITEAHRRMIDQAGEIGGSK